VASALRKTGLPILGEVPWGSHLCLFHETKQDLLDTLVPFFKAGLDSHEFCVWAVSDPLTLDEARAALRRDPGLARFLAAGSVEILPGYEWYLSSGGVDHKWITAGWHEKLRAALARGYAGLRASGNAFWLQTEYWDDFYVYERELDAALADRQEIALCTYPLDASRAADMLDVARAHQLTVARRRGNWELVEAAALPTETHPLTPREREVLTWVAHGKSAWEIGEILHIGKRTVDEHAQSAIHKLGAANRVQAVAIALRDHLIDLRAAHARRAAC
jgi:DNA-binding CsgD family transcriptional regulator